MARPSSCAFARVSEGQKICAATAELISFVFSAKLSFRGVHRLCHQMKVEMLPKGLLLLLSKLPNKLSETMAEGDKADNIIILPGSTDFKI
eukprot:219822-Pelagomonas_calceolata.AAC.1